jgi:hypothetical protein
MCPTGNLDSLLAPSEINRNVAVGKEKSWSQQRSGPNPRAGSGKPNTPAHGRPAGNLLFLDRTDRLLELEGAASHIALDLKDVTLVDCEAISFLTDCEANSIKLENCPSYVRERIEQESGRPAQKKERSRR